MSPSTRIWKTDCGRNGWAAGLLLAISFVVGSAGPALGQEADRWVGTEVVLESADTTLTIGSQVVASGRPQRVFRVTRVKGNALWLEAGDVRGWVGKDEVIPFQKAMDDCNRACLTAGRPSVAAYFRRGNLWLCKQEWARAVDDYTVALQQAATDPVILHNRGLARSQLKDYDRAIADFSGALLWDPQYDWAYEGRGRVWAELGKHENAIADFSEALRLDPSDLAALLGRGLSAVEARRFDAALTDLTEVLRRNPKLARAHAGLGFAWKAKQQYERALNEFHAAILLDSNLAGALGGVATIRAACPDPRFRKGAVALAAASRALKLHGEACPHCLDTLAAAHAESGDFGAAVKYQTQALATQALPETDQQSFRTRLALYQAKKPYRDLPVRPAARVAAAPPPAVARDIIEAVRGPADVSSVSPPR